MAQAAYLKKIKVSTTGTSGWLDLPATGPSMDFGSEVQDKTDLESNVGFRDRMLTIHDWSISCDCNWSNAHAALIMVRDAKLNRTALYVQYLPVGDVASGWQGEVVVESFNQSGAIADLEGVSITLQGSGALAAAT